jgi:hypothetical protein
MRSFRILLCAILFSVLAATNIGSARPILQTATQPPAPNAGQSIEGSWEGPLSTPVGRLRLVLNISNSSSRILKATLDSPDQGASSLPVDQITFTDSFLRFEMKDIQATFEGA